MAHVLLLGKKTLKFEEPIETGTEEAIVATTTYSMEETVVDERNPYHKSGLKTTIEPTVETEATGVPYPTIYTETTPEATYSKVASKKKYITFPEPTTKAVPQQSTDVHIKILPESEESMETDVTTDADRVTETQTEKDYHMIVDLEHELEDVFPTVTINYNEITRKPYTPTTTNNPGQTEITPPATTVITEDPKYYIKDGAETPDPLEIG